MKASDGEKRQDEGGGFLIKQRSDSACSERQARLEKSILSCCQENENTGNNSKK